MIDRSNNLRGEEGTIYDGPIRNKYLHKNCFHARVLLKNERLTFTF
jgi:hypothetical protein